MPDNNNNILTADPTPTPETAQPSGGQNIPETYGDYLATTKAATPKFVLPLPKKYELLKPSQQFVYDTSNAIGKMFSKVSQPEFLTNANTIADIHADKINQLTSLEPATVETPEQKKALDIPKTKELDIQQKQEKDTTIKDWGDLLGKNVRNGTIIKVDPYFMKADRSFFNKLKELNPTWTGEYVQMQSTKDGKIVPKAYNMATAFKTDPKAFSQNIPSVTVMAQKEADPKALQNWIKEQTKGSTINLDEVGKKDYEKEHPEVAGLQELEKGVYYAHKFDLSDRLDFVLNNNQKLAGMLMQNPELFNAFKDELGKAEGADIRNEFGQAQVFGRALDKTFDMSQPSNPAAYDIVSSFQAIKNAEYSFNKMQNDLSAKMKIAGETIMRNSGMGDKITAYNFLQTQMFTNPKSVTDDDRKQYARLTLELNDAISKAGSQGLAQDWLNYQNNNKQFQELLKAYPLALQAATSKEGSEGIDKMLKQQKGIYIANNIDKLFPEVAKAEANQAQLDKEGKDKLSVLKSLYGGLISGVQTTVKGIAQLTAGDKGSFVASNWLSNKGAFEYSPFAQTANRPTNTGNYLTDFVNDVSNTTDEAGKQIGYMAFPLALSPLGGEAIELAPFAAQSYYDTQLNLRRNGVPDDQAQMMGLINAGLTGITMKVAFLPSRLMRSQIEGEGIGVMMDAFAGRKSMGEAIQEIASKLAPTTTDAKNAFMAMSQQLSMNLAEYYQNKLLNKKYGTNLPTNQFEAGNVFHNAVVMGGVTYMLGTLGRLRDRSAAKHIAVNYADENPLMFATAMDNAKQEAIATGRYRLDDLHEMEDAVTKYFQRQYSIPQNLDKNQRFAANHILDNINGLKEQHGTADENFKPILEEQIKAAQNELKKISSDPEAAIAYNNKVTEPVKDILTKIHPEEKATPFEGVLIRHGQTDANVQGRLNTNDEPLNEHGEQSATQLKKDIENSGATNLIVSPHDRATGTADALGLPYTINPNFREWNTGHEGGFAADFNKKYYVEHPDEKPEGGESFNSFLGRVQQARKDVEGLTDKTAVITSGEFMKLWESLDKSGGKWDEKAQIEYLKDSNDFDNLEMYSPRSGKRGDLAVTQTKADGKKETKETKGGQEGNVLAPGKDSKTSVQSTGAKDKGTEAPVTKAQMKRDKEAKVSKLLSRDPESPLEAILQHFVGKGKVSQEQFVRSAGFGGHEKGGLNISGGKQRGGKELISKKWALDLNAKKIDEFAEELADKFGGNSRDYEQMIVDTLLDHTKDQMIDKLAKMQGFEGLSDKEIIDSQAKEFMQPELTEDEAKEYSESMQENLLQHVKDLPDEVQKELLKLLDKYQTKYGGIDWTKLEEDTKGFEPDILELSDKASDALNTLINKNLEHEPESATVSEPEPTGDKGAVGKEAPKGKPETPEAKRAAVEAKYGKPVEDVIDDLEKDGRLKRDCPPTAKKKFSLRNLVSKRTA